MFELQRKNLIVLGLAVILSILLSFSFLSNTFAAGPNNYTKDNPAVKFSCFEKDKDGNPKTDGGWKFYHPLKAIESKNLFSSVPTALEWFWDHQNAEIVRFSCYA